MSEQFDPYYRWLGIPPEEQPADFYRLLGVRRFEPDADVIEAAADRQMVFIRTFALGAHRDISQSLLGELARARAHLLNPDRRSKYDAELRESLAGASERHLVTHPTPPPVIVQAESVSPLPQGSSANECAPEIGHIRVRVALRVLAA